jgi:broad-specificity NMP kinase
MENLGVQDRPRIHIFEGTDGVGKTTIATMDASSRGAQYFHAEKPKKDNWFEEYVQPLARPDVAFTCDRWHIGEIIWPRLFKRQSLFGSVDDYIESCVSLATLGAHVHLIIRPLAHIEKELRQRGEPRKSIRYSLQAQEMFLQIAELTSNYMPVSIYTAATLLNAARKDTA